MSAVTHLLTICAITKRPNSQAMIRSELGAEQLDVILATNLDDYFQLADEHRISCVLVEFVENSNEELEMISRIHAKSPRTPVIAFGNDWRVNTAVQAIKLGAIEVCEMPAGCEMLKNAIQQACRRNQLDSRQFHEMLPEAIVNKLSSVEARILQLFVQGRTTKEVGASLDVSIRTIHYRKKALLRKLGVQNRSEAIELIRIASGSQLMY